MAEGKPLSLKIWLYDRTTAAVSGALGLFSPRWASQYVYGRKAFYQFRKRSFVAADTRGPNKNWSPKNKTGDAELKTQFKRVLARARWLVDNNDYVDGGVRTFVDNVVKTGIFPQAKVKPARGKFDDRFNLSAETGFKKWARRVKFYQLQRLAARHLAVDGEGFVVWSIREELLREGIAPLWPQFIECDQLDDTVDGVISTAAGTIARRGIEFNRYGEPAAYYFLNTHPGDYNQFATGNVRVPAERVDHVFDQRRASQTRGVTRLLSVIQRMFNLGEYDDYEMIAAKLAACFGVFRKQTMPQETAGDFDATTDSSTGRVSEYIEPGRIEKLPYGEEIQIASHNRPGDSYEPFTRQNLRAASRGMGLSFEAWSGDYSTATYSSARCASLEERRGYGCVQGLLVDILCVPAWDRFIAYGVLFGLLQAPNYLARRDAYHEHIWMAPKWPWVDPYKDAMANKVQLHDLRTTSRARIAAETGDDIEDIFQELEREELADLRVPVTIGGTSGKQGKEKEADAGADDDQGGDAAGGAGAPAGSKADRHKHQGLAAV